MFLLEPLRIIKICLPGIYEAPILIYHSIGSADIGGGALPLELFKEQMAFFKNHGFEVVPLAKLIMSLKEGREDMGASPGIVSLTFDDGYEDNFKLVFPILEEYHFPATMFLIMDRLGERGYLSIGQIRQMAADKLVAFGSHTMAHRNLLHLGDSGLMHEIRDSKLILEDKLRERVDFFAYPWGAFSPRIRDVVIQSGYAAAFSTNSRLKGKQGHPKSRYSIKRMTIGQRESRLRFLVKLFGLGGCFAREIENEVVDGRIREDT